MPELYNLFMERSAALLKKLGGETGCRRLSAEFYARVGKDPVLRRLFPGKSLRCATESFGAFLIQFLGGDEEQTQYRWWLSLRESHARFRIEPAERSAWLKHMAATLEATPLDGTARDALRKFFVASSAYLLGQEIAGPDDEELAARWSQQRALDDTIAAIAGSRWREAVGLATRFASRPSVFVGLLARMIRSGSAELIHFAVEAVERDPALRNRSYGGRTLLHYAAGAGCREMVALLLRQGSNPDLPDAGGHTPLYRAANECGWSTGPEIVRMLVQAGADVNACGGVTRATPLHMAARRGFAPIAQTLLEYGAAMNVQDRKGDTPLDRAIHCRKKAVGQLLVERGAARAAKPAGRRQPSLKGSR